MTTHFLSIKERGIKPNLKSPRASSASLRGHLTPHQRNLYHTAFMKEDNFNRRDSKEAYLAACVDLN